MWHATYAYVTFDVPVINHLNFMCKVPIEEPLSLSLSLRLTCICRNPICQVLAYSFSIVGSAPCNRHEIPLV